MCQLIADNIPNFVSSIISTLLAAVATVLYVAHVKVERLRLEFNELAEILKKILDSRLDGRDTNQASKNV